MSYPRRCDVMTSIRRYFEGMCLLVGETKATLLHVAYLYKYREMAGTVLNDLKMI